TQTNCTDSDGGDDPNTFGEVTYNLNYAAEYRQTVSDSCYGDSVVFERYCNSEGAQRTYSRTCSAGTTCQGGACKAAVVQPTTLSVSFNPSFVRVGEPTVFEWIIPSNASKCYGSLGQYVDEAGNSYQKSGEYSFMPFPLESSASPHTRSLTCNLTGGGSVTEIAKVYRDYSNPPTCAKEGETIPVIANPPSCCAGLELIKPKIVGIAGIDGYCTAKCGNGVCDQATETPYNCSKDCIIVIPCPQLVPLAPGFCSNGTVVPGGKDSHNCALPPTCVLTPLSWCYEFKTNLQIGNSSTDVNALKIALQKEGFNPGASAVFEDNIASAVTGFQEKYSGEVLSPHGLTHGTGFVGPTTRAKLNELFKCVVLVPVSEQLGASIAVKSITPLLYVSPYNHKNYGAKECYQSKYCQGSLASIVDTNASKRWWYPAAWRANVLIEYTEKIEGDYTVSFQWVGDGYDPNCGGDIYVSENENGPWTKIVANQGAKTKQTVQRNIPFKFLKTDVCSSDYVSSHYGKGLGGWVGIKEIEVTKSSASLEL
ncbi:hypothetical protein KKG61_09775, partial [bacterium]|nr:hypothetical protein [Patescibacteria group bacterium]MBU1600372.1 hypothetical protein [bacterium]MBU2416426.1 hypothetical protein [Patescibacteria group bacterium]